MAHESLNDLKLEVTKLVSDKNMNNGKVYWWELLDCRVSCFKNGKWLYIKLPEPTLAHCGWADNYRKKKYNEAEIERVRGIWSEFIRIFKEKLESVDTGQQTMEEAFKDGILLENGEYGLKYEKNWKLSKYETRRNTDGTTDRKN